MKNKIKKINKKIISGLALMFVALSTILISSLQINQNHENKISQQKNNTVYIESVKKRLNSFFADFENKNINSNKINILNKSEIKNNNDLNFPNLDNNVISLMKKASSNFIENYLSKANSIEDLKQTFSDYLEKNNINIPNYKNYSIISSVNKTNALLQNESFSIVNKSYSGYKTVSQVSEEFIKAGVDSAIVGGVAAAAAVGFGVAAAWSFGAFAPWASAATVASISYFAQGAIFVTSGRVLKSNPSWILSQTLDFLKNTYEAYGTFNLIQKIRDAVIASRTLRGVQFATSWAVPVVNIVAFVLEAILNNYASY